MSIKKIILPNKRVRWEVSTRVIGRRDKKIRRRFDKKIEAEEFLRTYLDRKKEVNSTAWKKDAKDVEEATFKDEVEFWLRRKDGEFTQGYFRVINPALKRILKLYGSYKVSRFTPDLLFEFRNSLKQESLSFATQNRYTDLIVRIINHSFENKRINDNPTIGYKKARENSDKIQFWSEDEAKSFLEFASRKYSEGTSKRWIFAVYLLALETGMRAREIWGLKASDIPSDAFKLKVSKQALDATQTSPTKGKKPRFVPLSFELKTELALLIETGPHKPLFQSLKGQMIDHPSFKRRIFDKDVMESGLRKIRFHDLRHTAITLMVNRGVLLPVVQKIAGHANIKTTMRYVHVLGKDIDIVGMSFSLKPQSEPVKLKLINT